MRIIQGMFVFPSINQLSVHKIQTEFLTNNIYKFSSHLTGNTLRLRYEDRLAIVV
jgi:hypothetical protein